MEWRARGIFFLINFAGEIFLSFLPEGEGGQIGGIRVASFYFRLDKRREATRNCHPNREI